MENKKGFTLIELLAVISILSILSLITSTDYNATPNKSFVSGQEVVLSSKTGEYYLIVSACDINDSCTKVTSARFYLDNSPPTLSISNPYSRDDQWYNIAEMKNDLSDNGKRDKFVLSIETSDSGGGVDAVYYTYNGSNTNVGTDPYRVWVRFDEKNLTKFKTLPFVDEMCRNVYKAGNCKIENTLIKIDITAPLFYLSGIGYKIGKEEFLNTKRDGKIWLDVPMTYDDFFL